jgi:hypothetical protein
MRVARGCSGPTRACVSLSFVALVFAFVHSVNSADLIFSRTGSTLQSAGRDWQQAPGGLAQIHADAAGAVWGTNAGGQIYRRTGISPQSPAGQSWEQVEVSGTHARTQTRGHCSACRRTPWLQPILIRSCFLLFSPALVCAACVLIPGR